MVVKRARHGSVLSLLYQLATNIVKKDSDSKMKGT